MIHIAAEWENEDAMALVAFDGLVVTRRLGGGQILDFIGKEASSLVLQPDASGRIAIEYAANDTIKELLKAKAIVTEESIEGEQSIGIRAERCFFFQKSPWQLRKDEVINMVIPEENYVNFQRVWKKLSGRVGRSTLLSWSLRRRWGVASPLMSSAAHGGVVLAAAARYRWRTWYKVPMSLSRRSIGTRGNSTRQWRPSIES